jgi:hypothetical protein
VLVAVCDSISNETGIAPPKDDDLIASPYPTFRRYMQRVIAEAPQNLIVAFDEFERIEELIEEGKIPKDFLGFLRGLMQISPRSAFAFAGLHRFEEMTQDYFHPFFASIIPIRISFMSRRATEALLARPSADFALDISPEALELVYRLTGGQPYVVQLIGFLLVQTFNDSVFEHGEGKEPTVTETDVLSLVAEEAFYAHGRYYFTGIWSQAGRGARHQQSLLKVLARDPGGLDEAGLAAETRLPAPALRQALATLETHDVVILENGRWRIAVELFRRWLRGPFADSVRDP